MNIGRFAENLTLLGDETGLCALLQNHELRVTDLVKITEISQPRVSTHLGKLKEAGYVRDRKEETSRSTPTSRLVLGSEGRSGRTSASSDPVLASDRARAVELEAERRGDPADPL